MNASGVILAGGRSKRLGRDKSLLELGGEPLVVRAVNRLKQLSSDIVVVTAADHPLPLISGQEGVRVVVDRLPGSGALGGILTGLYAALNSASIVVACDMPFLNARLLQHMVELHEGYDIVIPRLGGGLEPLHAVYSKSCLPAIERVIEQGELKILSFFPYVRVRHLDEAEIDVYDPDHLSFMNVNTEEDVKRAIEIEGGSEKRGD